MCHVSTRLPGLYALLSKGPELGPPTAILSLSIGPESDNYRLSVFDYRGNASDSFSAHNGYLFSTVDRDNDEAPDCCPCAPAYGGGWWFYRWVE